MIHFPPLRTKRLTIQLRELTIGDAIALAAMPPDAEEACVTAFLRRAVESATGISDPQKWSVQERTLAVCHYLAATADDGPNFSVGEAGHYADYLDGAIDAQNQAHTIEIGDVGGDKWSIRYLTGGMAEAVERLQGEVPGLTGRLHWVVGAMAAQLVMAGEDIPDEAQEGGAFDEHLVKRIQVLQAYPESDFITLMALYMAGRDRIHHLFRMDFGDDGLVYLPTEGAETSLPPARFPADTCVSAVTKAMVGKHDDSRVEPDRTVSHIAA